MLTTKQTTEIAERLSGASLLDLNSVVSQLIQKAGPDNAAAIVHLMGEMLERFTGPGATVKIAVEDSTDSGHKIGAIKALRAYSISELYLKDAKEVSEGKGTVEVLASKAPALLKELESLGVRARVV